MSENWLEVPNRVQEIFAKYARLADQLVENPPNVKEGWILNTEEVGPIFISKHAFDIGGAIAGILHLFSQGVGAAEKLVGGPNPLTAGLVGGAMGAGLGYGGGWLAHKVLPKYFDDDAARKWSTLGAVGGGVLPLAVHGYPNVHELGWKGLFQPSRYQGRQGGFDSLATVVDKLDNTTKLGPDHQLRPDITHELNQAWDHDNGMPARPDTPDTPFELVKNNYDIEGTLKAACEMFGIVPVEDQFLKHAADDIAGAWLGDIPTDQWGRTIMYDPYLDDHSKAIAAGLPAAAAAATGSRWVSPVDVARVAANTALGRVTGWGIGQLAKTFLGITPYAQQQLQQAGTLAGAVRGVLGMIN
jgi:hypothetical protein